MKMIDFVLSRSLEFVDGADWSDDWLLLFWLLPFDFFLAHGAVAFQVQPLSDTPSVKNMPTRQLNALLFLNVVLMTNRAYLIFARSFSNLVFEKWNQTNEIEVLAVSLILQKIHERCQFLNKRWITMSSNWAKAGTLRKTFVRTPCRNTSVISFFKSMSSGLVIRPFLIYAMLFQRE